MGIQTKSRVEMPCFWDLVFEAIYFFLDFLKLIRINKAGPTSGAAPGKNPLTALQSGNIELILELRRFPTIFIVFQSFSTTIYH